MGYYLELEKKKHSTGEVAGVFLEEGVGVGVVQRINPYLLREIDGRPEFELSDELPFAKEERKGVENIFELARGGYKLIFWFSPPGGPYIDGRLVVGRVKKVEPDLVELECRGLILKETPEQILKIAQRILENGGVSMDPIYNPENLREQAVGVNTNKDWCTFGEEMVGMPEVWRAIREGRDVVRKQYVEKVVVGVREEMRRLGMENNTYVFEQMMARRGFRLNAMGNHGGTHEGGEMMEIGYFGRMFGSENMLIGKKDERLKYCENCGVYFMKKKEKCPKCNK